MGWKEWPYWLKGGIFSISLIILLMLVLLPLGRDCQGHLCIVSLPYSQYPIIVVWLILGSISLKASNYWILAGNDKTIYAIVFIIPIVLYFIIGAFIGWIVGKIKSKQ